MGGSSAGGMELLEMCVVSVPVNGKYTCFAVGRTRTPDLTDCEKESTPLSYCIGKRSIVTRQWPLVRVPPIVEQVSFR